MRLSLLVLAASIAASPAAIAAQPVLLSHSGYLLDGADQPVTAAAASITFRVFDRAAPGAGEVLVWASAACSVPVTRGYYAAVLGSTCTGAAPITTDELPPGASRYLEVTVGGVPLLPRQPIVVAPAAALAGDAQALGGLARAGFLERSEHLGSARYDATRTLAQAIAAGSVDAVRTTGGAQLFSLPFACPAGQAVSAFALVGGVLTPLCSPSSVTVGTTAGTVAAGDDARFLRWSGGATGLDAATARASLGLGTAATTNASAYLASTGGGITGDLAVTGSVRVGADTGSCGAGKAGALRFNATTKMLEYCDGEGPGWKTFTSSGTLGSSTNPATSCKALRDSGVTLSDAYWLRPSGVVSAFQAYCDMGRDGGGWTLAYKIADASNMKSTGAVNASALATDDLGGTASGKLDDAAIRALYTEQFRTYQWQSTPSPVFCKFTNVANYADGTLNSKSCGTTYSASASYTTLSTGDWTYGFSNYNMPAGVIVQLNYGDGRFGSHLVAAGSTSDSGCTSNGGCHVQVWVR